MKIPIKVLINQEEIAQAVKLGFKKVPDNQYGKGMLTCHPEHILHFYIDESTEARDIIVVLAPSFAYRVPYDDYIVYELNKLFNHA